MKKRVFLLSLLALALWSAFGVSLAAAADEERPGGTTGAVYVTNKYIWTGDVTRYGEVGVEYHIDIQPGARIRMRWTCTSSQGGLDEIGPFPNAKSYDVSEANFDGSNKVLFETDTYCAYQVWAVSGGGFRITTSTVLFWNKEFVGGSGTNPTPSPGQTAPPGTVASPTPSPTPTASPAPVTLTCVLPTTSVNNCWGATYSGSFRGGNSVAFAPGTFIKATVTYDIGGDGKEIRLQATDSTSCTTNNPGCTNLLDGTYDTGTSAGNHCRLASGCNPSTWADGATNVVLGVWENVGSTTYYFTSRHHVNSPLNVAGTNTHTIVLTEVADGDGNPLPTPTPAPTASASPTPAPSCSPGYTWSGTNCLAPPSGGGGVGGSFPTYPTFAPAEPGPFAGSGGDLEEGPPNAPNGSGVGDCDEDNGTYSKPGQAPLKALTDTTFPGSINPLDYLPWIGNMFTNVPIVIGNAAQWSVNTGVDLVVPGQCVLTVIEDTQTALMEKAPFSIAVDLNDAIAGEIDAAGSGSNPTMTFAGETVTVNFSAMAEDVAPFRPFMGAAVWLIGLLGLLRLILGTLGVNNGGGE